MTLKVIEKGFKAYQRYLAIKAHFTTDSYDILKHKGKVRASVSSFKTRNDRYYFARVEKKYSKKLTEFFLANFIERGDLWIGDLVDEDADIAYKNWQKRFESLQYLFWRDMSALRNYMDIYDCAFDDLFSMKDNDHPPIFQMLAMNEISIESFIILDMFLNFIRTFDKKMIDDPIWSMYNGKIKKYRCFININKDDYRKVIKEAFVD